MRPTGKPTFFLVSLFLLLPALLLSQPADPPDEPSSKHIFGIIPNYRTSPSLTNYVPLSTKQKYTIAVQDSFDRGTLFLAASFAGQSQLTNSDRSFGQGVKGYAHYFATSYVDFVMGNFMTEAIYPSLLHQDPRYFRRGKGSALSRLGYAASQIFLTHSDSGRTQFNYSEIAGNSTAVAISMSYYPGSRTFSDAATKLGSQLAVDMSSNMLKEFWPDLSNKMARKHKKSGSNDAGPAHAPDSL